MKNIKSLVGILLLGLLVFVGYKVYQNSRNSKLSMGMKAPSIQLSDTQNQPYDWKDTQGSIVLLDFWASWCGPCRQNNPAILEIQHKYANTTFPNGSKGIKIIMVSLDDNKSAWINAIAQDHLQEGIIHISDLKAFKNQAALDYGINSIPVNFLINEKGYILGKDLSEREIELILRKL